MALSAAHFKAMIYGYIFFMTLITLSTLQSWFAFFASKAELH